MKKAGIDERLETWVGHATIWTDRVSWAALFFMMILTVADVLMRKLMNDSILGTVELTEMAMVVTVFFSLANCEMRDGHVQVDLLVSRLGDRTRAVLASLTRLLCFLLFIAATWSCLVYAGSMRGSGEVSQDLLIPIWPFVYVMAAGCLLLTAALLVKLLAAVLNMVRS